MAVSTISPYVRGNAGPGPDTVTVYGGGGCPCIPDCCIGGPDIIGTGIAMGIVRGPHGSRHCGGWSHGCSHC